MGDRLQTWEPWQWPMADDWRAVVERFLQSPTGRQLEYFVRGRLAAGATVYPPMPFSALACAPLAGVKVVILGQDPYHGPGQADGLAFSVAPGIRPPPSLRNIFAEIQRCGLGPGAAVRSGNLQPWAGQGVLLLNTSLTVEEGLAGSHAGQGWEALADELLLTILGSCRPVVFMLWGAHAQAKRQVIETSGHSGKVLVLCANHPSPLSARRPPIPFLGCGHFKLANAFLERNQIVPVDWAL